jgi:acetyl esterase/lipase
MKRHVFEAEPGDLPVVRELRLNAERAGDHAVQDVDALRRGNPARLGHPLIRKAVPAEVIGRSFGGVTGEWIRPPDGSDSGPVILYCHGGAYIRGSLVQGRPMASALAQHARGSAAAIAWAQAPERTFPAPIEDICAAYGALLAEGHAPKSIVFAGDSAGGAIIVAAMAQLRDRGVPLPRASISISPWADITDSLPSWKTNLGNDIVGTAFSKSASRIYLAGANPLDPRASPIHADLHGLPPMLVIIGDQETLLDDAVTLAERADAQGVEVELHIYRNMVHVFAMFNLRTGDAALKRAAEFIGSVR